MANRFVSHTSKQWCWHWVTMMTAAISQGRSLCQALLILRSKCFIYINSFNPHKNLISWAYSPRFADRKMKAQRAKGPKATLPAWWCCISNPADPIQAKCLAHLAKVCAWNFLKTFTANWLTRCLKQTQNKRQRDKIATSLFEIFCRFMTNSLVSMVSTILTVCLNFTFLKKMRKESQVERQKELYYVIHI